MSHAALAALLLVGACASDPPAPAPVVADLPAVASLPMAVVPEAGEAVAPTQLAAANEPELRFLAPGPLTSLDEAVPALPPVVVDLAALEAAEAVRPAGAELGYLVLDLETGAELAARNPDLPLIPASTAKLVTALVALDVLGPEHRYRTELRARGQVANGVLEGDLVLRGGGDPLLDLAGLLELAVSLRTRGIQRVAGDFLIDDLSLPRLSEIEPTQPLEAAYNPSLGALSLAFNRVQLTWSGGGGIEAVTLPPLAEARFQAAAPALLPPGGVELAAVGPEAAVWRLADRGRRRQSADLPVKDPGLHAGAVFRRLALAQGVLLAPPQRAAAPVEGAVIAVHQSAPLRYLVHDMLLYSNNMMAELIGLSAAARLGPVPDLAAASALLLRHLEGLLPEVDWRGAELANHSGLDGGGRMTARQLAAILQYGWRSQALPALLPASGWSGTLAGRYAEPDEALRVWAKTGAVNYGNALAGFMFPPTDRPAVFVAMISDLSARAAYDALPRPARADEARAHAWTARARAVQSRLIDAWLLPLPTS